MRPATAQLTTFVCIAATLTACSAQDKPLESAPEPAAKTATLNQPTPAPPPGPTRPPANASQLTTHKTVSGNISPKSVTASGSGLVSAHNMMYTHTVTLYNADGALQHTVPDAVNLNDFGIKGHPGRSQGAPVEGVFSPDGKNLYVSNYSMYGNGFGPEGKDSCRPGDGTSKSFVYRIDAETGKINQVIPAGAVPKFLAMSPDGATLLVSNWCTWDVTIIDTATGKVRNTVKAARYPRGMVFTPDGTSAFVANMGAHTISKINVETGTISKFANPGKGPRHVVISPDGKFLYVTNNRSGTVVKLDVNTGAVVGSVMVGSQPRSMAISTDGLALYVVAYKAHRVVKIDTELMKVISKRKTGYHPIGVAYEPTKHRVWVANYGGTITIFNDLPKTPK